MKIPLKIRTRGVNLTKPAEREIEARAANLEKFYDRLTGCRVTVEGPGGHHRQGRCRVRIQLTVPGTQLLVTHQAGEDLHLAIREAFHAADRRLEDYVRKLRADVKVRHRSSQGRVLRLFREDGYGFLEVDGREIYFNRNSVLAPGFNRLRVGARVRFTEDAGEKGPQASTVAAAGGSH